MYFYFPQSLTVEKYPVFSTAKKITDPYDLTS